MDPYASCQDIERCQICDDGIAELFCVSCNIKLCRRCTGGHLAEDPEKHNIIKNIDKYITLIFPVCVTHSLEQCKNYCQQCDLAVCSYCISSKSHERHKFLKIEDIFNSKKEIIKNDSYELEQEILSSYEEIVKQVKFNGKKLKETFEEVLSNIEKQRKIWHQEIDFIVNALKDDVCDMRNTQMKAQNDHLNSLQEILADVKQLIQRHKDLLESLEISKSLSYESMNSTLRRFPPKLEISVPRFIPKAIENELSSEMIGVISGFCISNQEGGYQLESWSYVASRGNRIEEENRENISKKILDEQQIITIFKTEITGVLNIKCTNDRNLWVSSENGLVQLFKCDTPVKRHNAVLRQFEAGRGKKSIAVTKLGNLVYGKRLSNKICILKEDETDELINLNRWRLLSLCITATDGLFVCMTDAKGYSCRVVRFDVSEERQIIQYDSEGKRLYTPGTGGKYVKENRNGDVCVADFDGRVVVVTDKKGTFRFRYKTEDRPIGIATDSQAQIIVLYMYIPASNEVIHIIDKNGKFLRNIFQQCIGRVGLDIDIEDNLCLAEADGTVKKIRYMEQLNE